MENKGKAGHVDDGGDNGRPGRSHVKRDIRIIRTIIIIRSVIFQPGTVTTGEHLTSEIADPPGISYALIGQE